MNMSTVTDLCSIGTLFAFVLVCAGVLRLDSLEHKVERKFRTPYINSQFIAPALLVLAVALGYIYNHDAMVAFVSSRNSDGVFDGTVLAHNIPMWLFAVISVYLAVQCFRKKHSLIPVLGLISCLYMMAQIDLKNWIGFTIWLVIGLVIYFLYGYKKSKLNTAQ